MNKENHQPWYTRTSTPIARTIKEGFGANWRLCSNENLGVQTSGPSMVRLIIRVFICCPNFPFFVYMCSVWVVSQANDLHFILSLYSSMFIIISLVIYPPILIFLILHGCNSFLLAPLSFKNKIQNTSQENDIAKSVNIIKFGAIVIYFLLISSYYLHKYFKLSCSLVNVQTTIPTVLSLHS